MSLHIRFWHWPGDAIEPFEVLIARRAGGSKRTTFITRGYNAGLRAVALLRHLQRQHVVPHGTAVGKTIHG